MNEEKIPCYRNGFSTSVDQVSLACYFFGRLGASCGGTESEDCVWSLNRVG